MSTYIDHHRPPREGEQGWQILISWSEFTERRLAWLYGPGRQETPEAQADLASWRGLGKGRAVA